MKKIPVKIAIIVLAVLVIIITSITIIVFLINQGKLTSFIEQQVKTSTNLDIKITDINLNIFSGIELKQVSMQTISNQKRFKLECNHVTIQYNLLDLLNKHVKSIILSDAKFNISIERKISGTNPSYNKFTYPNTFNFSDYYPENLFIGNLSANNTKIQIKSDKYLLSILEMSLQINEIQSTKPFDITLNGKFSITDNSKTTQLNMLGKVCIKSIFSLPDEELSFLEGSNISINNLNLNIGKSIVKANNLEFPIEATLSPSDYKNIPNVSGKCVLRNDFLQLPDLQLTDVDIPLNFTIDYPDQITLSSKSINGNLLYKNGSYTVSKLISNIKTNINLKQPGSISLQTQVDTLFSKPASISGVIDMRNNIIRDTTFNIHNIDCKVISETFKSFIPDSYKEWLLNGNFSVDTFIETITDKTENDKSPKITAATDLSLSDLKFSSPDYDWFGEGISGKIRINTDADYNFSKMYFEADGTFEPFLVQLSDFTTDMRNRKTHLSIRSNYDVNKKHLTGIKGNLSWDSLGGITAEGNIMDSADNLQIDMDVEVKDLSIESFFETFVQDSVEYSNPELFNSRINGESNLSFHITGSEKDLSVNGRVNLIGLNFKYGNLSIEDVNVNLPVSFVYPRSRALIQKSDITDSQYGTIQFKNLFHGPLQINGIQIRPIIISNNFFIRNSFKIPVFDGAIDIKDFSVENTINHDRRIKLEFQFNNINLKKMAAIYELTPFEGTLNSSIMSFRQHKQKLYSKDEISINIFGGDITLSDLTLNNYLSKMREIVFSAEVNNLNLGNISDTYREWGNITGIINGHVNNFKLVAGEPSSFEIEIMTKKHPDINQVVSTKFLKNFVPGIGKVLDKVGLTNYKYAIMGVRARLENDYIKLEGAVREDEKELFMKGAGMKKLEIVFPNADRRVPFKTFLNSFKGILGSDIKDTQIEFK